MSEQIATNSDIEFMNSIQEKNRQLVSNLVESRQMIRELQEEMTCLLLAAPN